MEKVDDALPLLPPGSLTLRAVAGAVLVLGLHWLLSLPRGDICPSEGWEVL